MGLEKIRQRRQDRSNGIEIFLPSLYVSFLNGSYIIIESLYFGKDI